MQNIAMYCVDLVYLDPPFNSNRDYSAIYKDETGRPLPDQIEAFNDLWVLDEERERAIRHMPVLMRETGIDDNVAEFWKLWLNALRGTQPRLLAYLSYMTERLLPLRSIIKPTGSIYLHCDPTASHYIKVMMDGIFVQNEIIWKRTRSHGGSKRWEPIHDVILFYSRSKSFTWNNIYQDYDQKYLDDHYRFEDQRGRYRLVTLTGAGTCSGDSGAPWRGVDPTEVGRHWAVSHARRWNANIPIET
jgi:adenine specific DNA methylase Mod